MDDTQPIPLGYGMNVPFLELDKSHFLNQTTVLYGPSKTGKTVMIRHILHLLKGHCDQAIVISPTEVSNRSYSGIIPAQLIHTDMSTIGSTGKTKGVLGIMWDRQEWFKCNWNGGGNIDDAYELIPSEAKPLYDNQIKKIMEIHTQKNLSPEVRLALEALALRAKKAAISTYSAEVMAKIPPGDTKLRATVTFLQTNTNIAHT